MFFNVNFYSRMFKNCCLFLDFGCLERRFVLMKKPKANLGGIDRAEVTPYD